MLSDREHTPGCAGAARVVFAISSCCFLIASGAWGCSVVISLCHVSNSGARTRHFTAHLPASAPRAGALWRATGISDPDMPADFLAVVESGWEWARKALWLEPPPRCRCCAHVSAASCTRAITLAEGQQTLSAAYLQTPVSQQELQLWHAHRMRKRKSLCLLSASGLLLHVRGQCPGLSQPLSIERQTSLQTPKWQRWSAGMTSFSGSDRGKLTPDTPSFHICYHLQIISKHVARLQAGYSTGQARVHSIDWSQSEATRNLKGCSDISSSIAEAAATSVQHAAIMAGEESEQTATKAILPFLQVGHKLFIAQEHFLNA